MDNPAGSARSTREARAAGTIWRERRMNLQEMQKLIDRMYSDKDRKRGSEGTFLWLMEEVGELASAVREGSRTDKEGEFADVLAWLLTLANVEGIDLTAAMKKYTQGCPGCGQMVCTCNEKP
jgi:NTP pyrophosphatase (non-canonical NTP hydrolase)